jgi:hypothetical protein
MRITHSMIFHVEEHAGPTTISHIKFDAKVTDFFNFTKLLGIGAISTRLKRGVLESGGVYKMTWWTEGKILHSRMDRLS